MRAGEYKGPVKHWFLLPVHLLWHMKHVRDVAESMLQNMSSRRTIHHSGTVESLGPNLRSGVLLFSLSGREKKNE